MAGPMTATSRDELVRINRAFIEILESGEVDKLDELVAPTFVDHNPPPGLTADREGLKNWVRMTRAAFSDSRYAVEDEIVEGDKLVVRSKSMGRHTGAFQGMPATNKTFEIDSIDIIRFQDGKAIEHWGLADTATMLQQLGVMPGPAEGQGR